MNNMEIVKEDKLNDQELMRILIEDDEVWSEMKELEGVGVKFDFEIYDITDYHEFVKHYIDQFEWFYSEGPLGGREYLDYEIIDSQNKAKGRDGEVGHPDFVIKCTEDDVDFENIKGNKIYLEFKYNNDHLQNSQLEWMLDAVADGYTVQLMKVEKIN